MLLVWCSRRSLFMHTNTGHSGRMVVDTTIQSKNENTVRHVETLLPVDFDTSGPILADEIQKTLLCAMPPSTTLTALMDCSLGGSIITLPYVYSRQDESIHYNDGFEFEALIGLAIIGGILVAASGNIYKLNYSFEEVRARSWRGSSCGLC